MFNTRYVNNTQSVVKSAVENTISILAVVSACLSRKKAQTADKHGRSHLHLQTLERKLCSKI